MALSIEDSDIGEESEGTSVDVPLTVTAGNLLMVGVGYHNSRTINSIEWKPTGTPQSLTELVSVVETNDTGNKAALYYLKSPTTGTDVVRITLDSASGVTGVGASVVDAHLTTTFGTADSATSPGGGSDPATVTVGTASGELVVDCVVAANPNSIGANQTLLAEGNVSGRQVGASYQAGADGGVMSWTRDGGGSMPWAIVAVSVKPAGAGGDIVIILPDEP